MTNKRDFSKALAVGLAGSVALGLMPGAARAEAKPEEAKDAIMSFLNAIQSKDPAVVGKVLAPEFQIARSDGTGFNKADYLNNLPKPSSPPEVDKISATVDGDLLVARYVVNVKQTIDGKEAQTVAPRLSAFRKTEGGWLLSAHANFAKIG